MVWLPVVSGRTATVTGVPESISCCERSQSTGIWFSARSSMSRVACLIASTSAGVSRWTMART